MTVLYAKKTMDVTQQQMQRNPTPDVVGSEGDFFNMLIEFSRWAKDNAPAIVPMIELNLSKVQDNVYGDVKDICDYLIEDEGDDFNLWLQDGGDPYGHILGRAARASGRDWRDYVEHPTMSAT